MGTERMGEVDDADTNADDRRGEGHRGALYGMSLDLLTDLLRNWAELWSEVRAEIERLPHEEREALHHLPSDPETGLSAAVPDFARSFHPDVVEFLVSHLEAAAAMVDHLSAEEQRGAMRFTGDGSGLEPRIRRLESLIGGVGAVLRTLGEAPEEGQARPD